MKQWYSDHPYLTFTLVFWGMTTISNLLLRALEVWKMNKTVPAPPPNQFFIVDPTALVSGETKETSLANTEEDLN